MSFPILSAAPTLESYQLQFGGVTFGGIDKTKPTFLQSLVLDMPSVSAGDTQRALDQGELAGFDVLPGRDITITQLVSSGYFATGALPTTAAAQALESNMRLLGSVLGPSGAIEQPLFIQLPSGCYAANARARKHNCPFDINRVFAGGVIATSLLHATDPRFYGVPSLSETVGLPTSAGGAPLPFAFALGFGAGGLGGLATCVNAGGFETRPLITFTGPCTNPSVCNLSIAGAPYLSFQITLNAGDTLVVDTDLQTVIYTTAGTTTGVSRRSALSAYSTWFNLPPGSNTIEFNTSDAAWVAGTMEVQWANAWLTL
jgi:hypothetical protein